MRSINIYKLIYSVVNFFKFTPIYLNAFIPYFFKGHALCFVVQKFQLVKPLLKKP